MPEQNPLRANAARIDALLQELTDPRVRPKAEALVRLLMETYGAGLARVIEIADTAEAPAILERLCEDEMIAGLLILHGIHPWPIETRVERALERVRPHLNSHGGDVTLIAVNENDVTLRLSGNCDGCAASALTMKLAVEKAIEAAAPEVTNIVLEETDTTQISESPYQECPEAVAAL